MTAAKVMDIISRLPGCAGQAADAVSAYNPGKIEDAPKLLKKSQIGVPRYLDTSNKAQIWPKSLSSMEDPVVPLERNIYGHPLAGLVWERQFEKILLKYFCEKVSNWECLFVHREKKCYSYLFMWMTSNWLERNKTLIRCGKCSIILSTWENQHLSLIMYSWDALKDNVK